MEHELGRLTLHQLRVFRAVARHRSFTRAAGELHLTQPAVSIQVRELAALLGTPLLEVFGKKIRLTDAGMLLEEHAARLEGGLRELAQDFAPLREAGAGTLRIGASSSLGTYYLPPLLAEFLARQPRFRVSLEIGNTLQISERLQRNECDLGFLGSRADARDLIAEPFLEDEIFFACAPGHPLARAAAVDPLRLAKERLIVRETGSATRATMEEHLRRRGTVLRSFMELGSVEAIKQVVISGLGIAYFSALTVCNELAAGWLVRLRVRGLTASRTFFTVRHRLKKMTPALATLAAFARDWQPRTD